MLYPLPLRHYLDVLRVQGFDGDDIAGSAALWQEYMRTPEGLVDRNRYVQLVENIAHLDLARGLGLDIGLAFDLSQLGPFAHAALSCSTPRQSMEEFWFRYGAWLGVLGRPRWVAQTADTLTLEIVTPSLSGLATRFCVEEAFCLLREIGLQVAGSRPCFRRLELAFAAPAYAERYTELFGCPVHFNAPRTQAVLERAWFEQALPTHDAPLRDFYQTHLAWAQQQIEQRMSLAQRIAQRLQDRSAAAWPTLADVAGQLGLTERTLSRQLQQAGLQFRQLLQEQRTQQAVKLLQSPGATVQAVAQQVGFQDANAFRRAFKQWTGMTVKRYVQAHQRPPATPAH